MVVLLYSCGLSASTRLTLWSLSDRMKFQPGVATKEVVMALAAATSPTKERTGVVTFKGNPMTLVGPELKVGQKAPDFQVVAQDLSPVTLANSRGKIRLVSVVTALDTGICRSEEH